MCQNQGHVMFMARMEEGQHSKGTRATKGQHLRLLAQLSGQSAHKCLTERQDAYLEGLPGVTVRPWALYFNGPIHTERTTTNNVCSRKPCRKSGTFLLKPFMMRTKPLPLRRKHLLVRFVGSGSVRWPWALADYALRNLRWPLQTSVVGS